MDSFSKKIAVLALMATAIASTGFISTRTAGGLPVTWGRETRLAFRANETNSSGLSGSALFDTFTRSLNRWKMLAFNGFDFTYYQGTDTQLYPNYTGSSQDNSIFFTSAADANNNLTCGIVALTEVWFQTGNGQAYKADLRFNDRCFLFTLNPGDTAVQPRIYLPDVATHELGHALGLDHSQNLQSSMVFTAAIQEALPSCDDQAAMHALYSPGSVTSQLGRLTGRVLSPSRSPLFGAFVEAVSLERGVVLASAITDRNGTYTISGLEPGHYTVVVSPFYPGSSSLGAYYSSINSRVCNGANFSRSFAVSDGQLQQATVTAGTAASLGDLTVSCSQPTSLSGGHEFQLNTAPTLLLSNGVVATQSVFSSGSDHYYIVRGLTGFIEAHALAFSLYSPADVSVEILDLYGRRLAPQNTAPDVFAAVSGYVNFDSSTSINLGNIPTDIVLHIQYLTTLGAQYYPSRNIGVDASPFYALTLRQGVLNPNNLFQINARCERPDAFSVYQSSGTPGPVSPPNNGTTTTKGSGGCGMIYDPAQSSDEDSHLRFLNFAAAVMMLALVRFLLLHSFKNHKPY